MNIKLNLARILRLGEDGGEKDDKNHSNHVATKQ